MRATERLSLVDGDDKNANSDDNADCKIGSNNESPTPPANKKKERKRELSLIHISEPTRPY